MDEQFNLPEDFSFDGEKIDHFNEVVEAFQEEHDLKFQWEGKTTLERFNEKSEEILERAKSIREEKNPVYSLDHTDYDYHWNFRFIGKSLGMSPLEVWSVYMMKHVSSILTYVKNSDVEQPEKLDDRFADLINYILMGYSLYKEKNQSLSEEKNE